MTDARGVCASSATELAPATGYVRGWGEAQRAADALAEALTAFGLASAFPGLKGDVNVRGDGIVHLGAIRPAAACLLAGLIATGLTAEMDAPTTIPLPRNPTDTPPPAAP